MNALADAVFGGTRLKKNSGSAYYVKRYVCIIHQVFTAAYTLNKIRTNYEIHHDNRHNRPAATIR